MFHYFMRGFIPTSRGRCFLFHVIALSQNQDGSYLSGLIPLRCVDLQRDKQFFFFFFVFDCAHH